MTVVLFEDAAQDDLDALWLSDEDGAALIFALIEEFQDNSDLSSVLRQHGHRDIGDPAFEVSRFQELWHQGFNLYRLKYWDEDGANAPYRIIYADNPHTDQIHILGIVHRGINYDTTHPIFCRIVANYGRLGIPTY